MLVIKLVPLLSRREVASPREPVSACKTHDREQCVFNFVEDENRRIRRAGPDGGLMKHHHLWELGQKELLPTAFLLTLFARPVWDGVNLDRFCDRVRDGLLGTGGCNRELVQCIGAEVAIVAVFALNDIRNLEARELVKEGNLITQKLYQFMRVANAFARWHIGRDLYTFIQGL